MRKTEIVLLDGKPYTFCALPFTRKTIAIMEGMETNPVPALMDAIILSLSLNYGDTEAEQIVESGVIPFFRQGDELCEKIQAAMFPTE